MKEDVFSCNKADTQFIIYTAPGCPKCEAQKKQWDDEGISYKERDASRLKNPSDAIDKEGLVVAAIQNEKLPIVVELEDVK